MMNNALKAPARLVAGLLPIVLLLLSIGCDRLNPPADQPRMDRLELFGDNDLVLRFSDTEGFFQALADSPLGQLWQSEAMADFRNGRELGQELLEAVARGAAATDDEQVRQIHLDQFKMLRGEVIVGLDFRDPEASPSATIAAHMEEADFNLSLEMDKRLFELEQKETLSAVEDFRGVKLYTYITKEDGGDRFSHQAFCGGTLVASENRNWVEQAVVRLLATPAREPKGAPLFSVNGRSRMFDRLKNQIASSSRDKESPVDVQALIHALGIDALGDVDFTMRLEPDRMQADFRVGRQGEWNRGLMVVLPAEAAPLDLRLAYVPANPMNYQVSRLDLNALWQEIPKMLGAVSPEAQMQFGMATNGLAGMAQIDLSRDLFGNLDGLFFSYARLDGDAQQMLYGFKVRDAEAMGRTLERLFGDDAPLAAQLGDMYTRADIQGKIVHSVRFPVPAPEGNPTVYGEIALTVLDRALIIGQGELVMEYVQSSLSPGESPEFYASKGFRLLSAQLPQGANSYGLSDFAQYARLALNQIRQIAAAIEDRAGDSGDGDSADGEGDKVAAFLQRFDLDRLPPDDTIARYMGTGTSHSLIDAGGLQVALTIHYPEI